MLPGEARADLAPVMDEHVFVMTEHDIALCAQRRVGGATAAPEPIGHLASKPRPAIASPTDHQAVGARLPQCLIGVLEADNVAIGDNRNSYRVLDKTDEFPVGETGIELASCSTMHSNHPDA